ncbi:MAG TPA: S8 family serine peptidase, partial [Blastocatellia bacterium]|nr:S8 family serine peptidase [Blastocatellia bacterium]
MKLRILTVLILVASMFAAAHSSASGLQQGGGRTSAKIAPWVLQNTADGKEAEFLVILADQADLSAAENLPTKEEKGWYVYRTLYEKAQVTQQPILAWLNASGVEHRAYYIVNMIWVKAKFEVAQALAARADVARIDGNPVIPNELPQPIAPPGKFEAAAPAAISSGVSYSRAPEVWAIGYNGQGIVVGGADTGYQWDHPALKPHYRGWNGTTANHDYNWHDSIHSSSGTCVGDSLQPCDDNGHGTHTIGTAIGDDGGTNQIGMAPGAQWIGCRNMDQGNGTPTTYAECFQFFLAPYPVGGTPAQGDPTKAPDVTTHSWGCPPSEGCTPVTWLTIQSAIQANRAAGIVTVVSAGNSGSSCSTVRDAPSFFPEVVTVGALNTGFDTIASFSSRGPVTIDGSNRQKPDIVAPGTSIRSSVPVNGYSSSFSGTSMAAPHVAGAVALLLSADPARRGQVSAIEGILKESAVHVPSSLCSSNGVPNNLFGHGRLDAKVAADLSRTTIAPSDTVVARNGGRGAAAVTAPTTTTPWTAVSNDGWIVVTSPAGGTGSRLVTYEVRENFTGHFRIGALTIAQRTHTVLQSGVAAASCDNSIAPAGAGFESGGGVG